MAVPRSRRADEGRRRAGQLIAAAARDPRRAAGRLWFAGRRRIWAVTPTRRVSRDFVTPATGPAQHAFERFAGRRRFRQGRQVVVILTTAGGADRCTGLDRAIPQSSGLRLLRRNVPEWNLQTLGAQHLSTATRADQLELKKLGPVDVLIDLIPHPTAEQRALFNRLFWHLKARGVYVIDPAVSRADPFGPRTAEWMSALLQGSGNRTGARAAGTRNSRSRSPGSTSAEI